MNLVVLISCMHQDNYDIVRNTNVQTDVVIVNQCDINTTDKYTFTNQDGRECNVVFVNTTERGLSRSRNMAIKNAEKADICLICDDDEILSNNYEKIILDAYSRNPDAGVIAFALDRKDHPKEFSKKIENLTIKGIMKTSSQQITFNREKILKNHISFDEMMGSGTGNGAGEENKFLFDCRKKGLQILYYPYVIATIKDTGNSKWFNGFTDRYFENLGWVSRRIHGSFIGFAYIILWWITHRKNYATDSSMHNAIKHLLIGYKGKR